MNRLVEDNTVAVLQKAIRFLKIRVTKSSVKEFLKSHPDYPTLKSVCDVLNEFNIENYPLKYNPEELRELNPPYIAHFKKGGGQIAFVTAFDVNEVTYYDSYKNRKKIGFNQFCEDYSGAIILINPDGGAIEPEYKEKRQNEILSDAVLPLIIFTIVFSAFIILLPGIIHGKFLPSISDILLCIADLFGIFFSLLLVLNELDIHSNLSDKLCHLNKMTDCNAILNNSAAKVFGWIGWADVGSNYFIGSLLILMSSIIRNDLSLLAIVSVLTLPYPVYSVYYQGFVLKKWCPLCLGVQLILGAEFCLLFPRLSYLKFSFSDLCNFIIVFLITGLVYSLFLMNLRSKRANDSNSHKYLSLKKNPFVLQALLLNQKYYDIPVTDTSLIFGPLDSQLTITAFMSLNCSHCARAFNKIKDVLKSDRKIKINIVLVTSAKEILNTLYYLNRSKETEKALDILDKWYSADSYSRQSFSEDFCIPDVKDVSEKVGNSNVDLFKSCDILGTPTLFINGYRLPKQYDLNDIKLFSKVTRMKESTVFK
jgi:uncharacterized membrane protein